MKEWKNKTIDIFGVEWNIIFEDKIIIDEDDADKQYFGLTNQMEHAIRVATHNNKGTRLSDNAIEDTLYHEVIHALLDEGCYGETQNEPLVEWLAKGIKSMVKQKVIG